MTQARGSMAATACAAAAVFLLKLTLFITMSPHDNKLIIEKTHYGGITTHTWHEYMQEDENSCGAACLAFLLSKAGYETTQEDVHTYLNSPRKMLSFSDMEKYIAYKALNSQSLKVNKRYFKANPTAAILHFGDKHFIVFVSETANKKVVLFDPAYGCVYTTWKILFRNFDGNMFYIYAQ